MECFPLITLHLQNQVKMFLLIFQNYYIITVSIVILSFKNQQVSIHLFTMHHLKSLPTNRFNLLVFTIYIFIWLNLLYKMGMSIYNIIWIHDFFFSIHLYNLNEINVDNMLVWLNPISKILQDKSSNQKFQLILGILKWFIHTIPLEYNLILDF